MTIPLSASANALKRVAVPAHAILVAGGGPVGLLAALVLTRAGHHVRLVAPASAPAGTGPQARSAALFPASLALLENVGVFEACRAASAPLRAIRLVDDTGSLLRAPEVVFSAAEAGLEAFGYNVPNAALVAALEVSLGQPRPNFSWSRDVTVTGVTASADGTQVALSSGERAAAALVVGADGRNSACRAAAGITTRTWSYDQVAITANFDHSRPHDGISTEFHRTAGPCTTVPLPGRASSLVWVERPAVAARLLDLDDTAFIAALETRLMGVLGRVERVSPRGQFALGGVSTSAFAQNRTIVIGEAAHVMPPIGAQGLNLGLRDVGCLVDAVAGAVSAGHDVGGPEMLAAYDQARRTDTRLRMTAVDVLNRSLLSDLLPVHLARGLGLHLLAGLGPVRRRLIQEGLQPSAGLPRLMRSQTAGTRSA
jgi:2-octaprenyl-6-methoxyphenol hydroxylase